MRNIFIGRAAGFNELRSDKLFIESSDSSSPLIYGEFDNDIVMGNTGKGGEWSFGAGTNFFMKQEAVGTTSAAKTTHLTLFASGDLEISDSITTEGRPVVQVVMRFSQTIMILPSISEHAQQMYARGHLPNVGPTVPGQEVNLTDKMGNLFNELEHAGIYIAQLEKNTAQQQSELAALNIKRDRNTVQQKSLLAALTVWLEQLETR